MTLLRAFFIILPLLALGAARADPPEKAGSTPASHVIPRMPLTDDLPAEAGPCALEKYVQFDDGAYEWKPAGQTKVEGATVYNLRLTSQRWRSESETDHPLWKHWVTIAVPDKIQRRTAILIIGGGRHREQPPVNVPAEMLMLVRAAGSVVVYVDNVPNQPLKLEGEEQERYEDNLVARSWVLAMRDDDASWLVRFPMVKSAVKAMDAAEAFLAEQSAKPGTPGDALRPQGFFVVGASKRGWTTWLTAAVDKRVKAIAPMVIDVLNMKDHTPHHWRSYGFWAPTLKDYENNGIPAKFGSPELARVIAHEDPLAYVQRVKNIPKYIVNATGDEFFPTDSLRHYEDKIPGVWRARCVPNAGHSLRNTTAPLEILAFFRAVAHDKKLPEMTWAVEPAIGDAADRLVVRLSEKPLSVTVWESTNERARDFRFNNGAGHWTDTIIAPSDDSHLVYTAALTKPATGWRATLVECRFPGAGGAADPLVFTTRVFITPDTLPFELPNPREP